MEHVKKNFPKGLPKLADLAAFNAGKPVPPETAWIWGADDEIGRINLLTPEVTRAAQEGELKDGKVVSLNWSLAFPKRPSFHRSPLKHRIEVHPLSPCIFDDFYDTNSQAGSQWDGLRHFGHLGINKLYNNLDPKEVLEGTRCGIQAISKHGIAGRGVLLDYYGWAKKQGRPYDPTTQHAITVKDLQDVAKAQNVEFRVGDILFIRSGYVSRYHELEKENPAKLEDLADNPAFAGVEQSEEMKTFLHDQYFAAVAGDAPAFEVWPRKTEWYLHEYLLGLWGCLIGEMIFLEDLAQECEKRQRWTFFTTSAPLNSPGGIASFANALAFF
ncbi:hypothetical protein SPI_05932 [Niveomyces insectorum RCEF 264]|uniref:Cyclase n=1 Tax=Niveomyces insectorum RCEF 264 TaxID=1081102 RepID=A0A167SLJ1_9HYPO|nr:hypothetical protein SPI_05932 [Niveomyces insectorum RCEF 264]